MDDKHATDKKQTIRAAQVVVPCGELQPTLDFFVERLGFRPESISPADDPRSAVLSGHGLVLHLRRGSAESPGTLRLLCDDPQALGGGRHTLVAPNGTRVELADATPPLTVPEGQQELVVTRADDESAWSTGRAGMRYRDLIPGRVGGRFVASRIQIHDEGPVPDRVHFHAIRFQMIYCVAGWVRLAYEDQGPPFVLAAGDCVLQPPRMRHRVLESSGGLEVIEVACPAEHDTFFDHELDLPTTQVHAERDYGGQRFVRHQASAATWRPWTLAGLEYRDLGFATATDGLASARVVRGAGVTSPSPIWRHDGELLFVVVLAGRLTLEGVTADPLSLTAGDSMVVPPAIEPVLSSRTKDLELLEVRLPGPSE